jgi:hypothetical protein
MDGLHTRQQQRRVYTAPTSSQSLSAGLQWGEAGPALQQHDYQQPFIHA